MSETYPFKWTANSKDEQERRAKYWTARYTVCVKSVISSPLEVNMPKAFFDHNVHTRLWTMKPRPDDVWVCTYPKAGTTMMQELVWQMSTGCNVKSEESKIQLFERSPFLEAGGLKNDDFNEPNMLPPSFMIDPINHAENLKSPRVMKSHLPISMLPPTLLDVAKVIVVARNAKDSCVSYYHHEKLMTQHHGWEGTFDEYAKFYMEGKPCCLGDYWVHLKDSLKWSESKNLLHLWYEDIITNFEESVKKIAAFTGFSVSEDQMKVLKEHMKIDNFRQNDAVNLRPPKGVVPDEVRDNFSFIRKGKTGDWKGHFTCEKTLNEFHAWINKNGKDSNGQPIKGVRYDLQMGQAN